jgi:glucose-1-phosphate adenylyltransferase
MELLTPEPPIELYDPAWPILTVPGQLPPARLLHTSGGHGFVADSLLSGGVVVRGATVTNSVLSGNVHVADGTLIDEAVVLPNARIGANCKLRRVIVDAGVEVPDGTTVGWQATSAVESVRTGGRVTLLARNWSPEGGDEEIRSVA